MQLRALRSASTFNALANLYEGLPRSRQGGPTGARSLSPYGKPYVTLRWVREERELACRYHKTDVVIWRREPDGDYVDVRGYNSASTETFANSYTPFNISFSLKLDDGYYVSVKHPQSRDIERCYEFKDVVTFKVNLDGWATPVAGTIKTNFIDVNSPLLRVALNKTRYFDFMAWSKARLALLEATWMDQPIHQNREQVSYPASMMALLADPNKWDELLFSREYDCNGAWASPTAWLEAVGEHVRRNVYRHLDAIPVREVEWYPWAQFKNQRRLRAKYPWVVY